MGEAAPSQILVVRLSSIGDVLLATPLVRALRREYPGARLRFLVKAAYADLVRLNPHLDEVVLWPAEPGSVRRGDGAVRDRALGGGKPRRPAGEAAFGPAAGGFGRAARGLAAGLRRSGTLWVVDLQASPRTLVFARLLGARRSFTCRKDYLRRELLVRAKVDRYPDPPLSVAERYFEAVASLRLAPDGCGLDLRTGAQAERRAAELLGPVDGVGWIAVAPGSRWATKRWPPESFAAAARELAGADGRRVALLGSAVDAPSTDTVARLLSTAGVPALDLAGRLSLLESAAVLRRCALLLTNDSGPMHLAAAVRLPAVALFGSTVPQFGFMPYRSPARVLGVEGLSCRPCTHMGREACPLGHFRCMRGIAPPRVVEAARDLLRSVSLRIRRAEDGDRERIWRVHTRSILGQCRGHYTPHEISAWVGRLSPGAYMGALRTQEAFVAERGGEVVGFAQLDPAVGEVEAVYVVPEAAAAGVGSALLARLEQAARERGLRRLRLRATLNAEPFYAARGYRGLGRCRHRLMEGVALDCVGMEKALD